MSEEKKGSNILQSFIAKPTSLDAERAGRDFFLDSHGAVIPNEGNLLSLMTLQKFYKNKLPMTFPFFEC